MIYILIFAIITPAIAQVPVPFGVRPDVTFGGSNSRFDVSNIMRFNQKHLNNAMDSQSDEYRRRGSKKRKTITFDDAPSAQDNDNKKSVNDKELDDKQSWLDVVGENIGNKHVRKNVIKKLEDHVNKLANIIITKLRSLRRFDDFAYHDNMDSIGEADFEQNLKNFRSNNKEGRRVGLIHKLHGLEQTRKNMENPEKAVLLKYAFPINMKIEGFLQKT